MSRHNISVLLLAAGSSSRMGRVKQLLPWGSISLIEHALKTAAESKAKKIYVVLGAHSDLIQKKIAMDKIAIIENPDWESGMGSSIAIGVKNILSEEDPDGILIMLCDQPLIDPTYLNSMIQAFSINQCSIVGTSYNNKIGVPAIFAPDCYPDLEKLEGDEGARSLIVKRTTGLMGIDPKGKQADIDTAEDYSRFAGRK